LSCSARLITRRSAEEADAYEDVVEAATPLAIGGTLPRETSTPVFVIALDGHVIAGKALHVGGLLWIDETDEPIVPGMSGSPVLDERGAAIGVISRGDVKGNISRDTRGNIMGNRDSGGNAARLLAHLPGWLLVSLGAAKALHTEAKLVRAYLPRQRLLKGCC
jgi:hypothetical protein